MYHAYAQKQEKIFQIPNIENGKSNKLKELWLFSSGRTQIPGNVAGVWKASRLARRRRGSEAEWMANDARKPTISGRAVTSAGALVLGMCLYVLSCGPVSVLVRAGYVSPRAYGKIYYPLGWSLKQMEPSPLIDVYERYTRTWDSWFGYD
jgi:hypothetical protein